MASLSRTEYRPRSWLRIGLWEHHARQLKPIPEAAYSLHMILIPADLCCRKTTAPGLAGAEEEVDDPDTEPEVSSSEEEYDTAPNPDNGEHWCPPIPEEQSLNPVAAELWLRQDETNVQNTITGVARSMTGRLAFSSVYHCLATAHSVSPFTPPIGGDQFCQSSLGGE